MNPLANLLPGLKKILPTKRRSGLRGRPRPLIDPDGRFVVFWSPKSACTTTAIWFFNAVGLADQAQAQSERAHRYRIDGFYKSPAYAQALKHDPRSMVRLRVFRDPYSRAVSSFRHVLSFGLDAEPIAAFLGRAVDDEHGITFRDYLSFLEASDVEKINAHHRIQRHPFERQLPSTEFINITKQDLFSELNAFERRMGLAVTDFHDLAWMHESEKRRARPLKLGTDDAYDLPLTPKAGRGYEPFPEPAALLVPEAKARIAKIYAADFEYFGPYL